MVRLNKKNLKKTKKNKKNYYHFVIILLSCYHFRNLLNVKYLEIIIYILYKCL